MGELNIGSHIRKLRLRQNRTLQEIANSCAFSKSLLSKIETNKVVPPVATLVKIAASLGTTVSSLIEEDDHVAMVFTTRKESENKLIRTEKGYFIFPYATEYRKKKMQPFMFVAKKGDVQEHHLSHNGEEFIYVLAGRMKFQVGNVVYTLKSGDGLYFNSREDHQVIPITKEVRYLDIFV
ncbi:MAG: helix-turn-helix domain-containing protein [Candidatus Aminicenantales bacterium]